MAAASSAPASTSMLTLKYSGAAASALIAVSSSITLLGELFGLWTDKYTSGYTAIVKVAVEAVVFAVVALLLYRQVTKDVAAQPEYVNKPVYHFITNGFFALLAGALVFLVAELVSILLSSLLLIGTSADIAAMYLGQFLPGLLAAALVGFVSFAAYKIMKGKNFSALMTIVLVSLTGALFIAALVTVPIKAHTTSTTTSTSGEYNYDSSNYFNTAPQSAR